MSTRDEGLGSEPAPESVEDDPTAWRWMDSDADAVAEADAADTEKQRRLRLPSSNNWMYVVALALIAVVVGVLIRNTLFVEDAYTIPDPEQGEFGVEAAVGRYFTEPVRVRGFIFEGDGWPLRLCRGRQNTEPPDCLGPTLDLRNLDENRLQLETAGRGKSATRWTPGPVVLEGTLDGGTVMTVTDIVDAGV